MHFRLPEDVSRFAIYCEDNEVVATVHGEVVMRTGRVVPDGFLESFANRDTRCQENAITPDDRRRVSKARNRCLPRDVLLLAPFDRGIGVRCGPCHQRPTPLRPEPGCTIFSAEAGRELRGNANRDGKETSNARDHDAMKLQIRRWGKPHLRALQSCPFRSRRQKSGPGVGPLFSEGSVCSRKSVRKPQGLRVPQVADWCSRR